ncbi:MAG: glycosyltransferase [Campylobacterales bacterium]|nr:glycosyltransferase [Campylobacterales bacterium]
MSYAPIVLFVYNRLEEVKLTINALQKNYLADASDLYIFSDGAKNSEGKNDVNNVRKYLETIQGFHSITIIERDKNFGLAKSVIEGASEILNKYQKIIVLEDDIVTSPNFLCYMNQALDFYKDTAKVFSISGHTIPLNSLKAYKEDVYIGLRPASWGWATWIDRWQDIDWEITDYKDFIQNKKAINKFNMGGVDLTKMLQDYMNKKNNSWAIRWAYAMYKVQKYTIYPTTSKVNNIGFSTKATHCNNTNIYDSKIDNSNTCKFNFIDNITPNKTIINDFKNQYTFYSKLKKKILEYIKTVSFFQR